jgi:hypothetical protein
VKKMTKANTQQAKTLGALAFARGVFAAALDGEMRKLQMGRAVGDARNVPELKAWIAGNTQARLAA